LYCPPNYFVDEKKRLELVETIKLFHAGERKKNLRFIHEQICLLNPTYRSLPNIVCAFLPQIPNMKIKLWNSNESSPLSDEIPRKMINKIVKFVKSKSNLKTKSETYVMSFCDLECYITASDFAHILNQNRYNLYLIQAIIHI